MVTEYPAVGAVYLWQTDGIELAATGDTLEIEFPLSLHRPLSFAHLFIIKRQQAQNMLRCPVLADLLRVDGQTLRPIRRVPSSMRQVQW